MQILSLLPSRSLLLWTAVSRHFQDLVTHIVHDRLTLAASLQDRKLILDCYHPSDRYSEPYLFCEYLGTSGPNKDINSPGSRSKVRYGGDRSKTLTTMYSRFKPVRADADPALARKHNPDNSGAIDLSGNASPTLSEEVDDEIVTRTVNMHSYQAFSPLCIRVVLEQLGPRPGIFLSCTDILEKKIARIWRQWLLENSIDFAEGERERMIWADHGQNVGLKVRVREKKWKQHAPILQHKDEDQVITYELDLEGRYFTSHSNGAKERKETVKSGGRRRRRILHLGDIVS
jgi:hypothetical protein